MTENHFDFQYLNYLTGVSKRAKLYRKYLLYPRVNKILDVSDVVDVGCGLGFYLQCIKGPNDAIGIDVNPLIVSQLQSHSLNAALILNGVFPLKSHSRSSLFSDQVLEHIDDPSFFLSECNRVLLKGGYAIFGVPCSKGYSADTDHKQFYTLSRLRSVLKPFFSIESSFYSPFPFAFIGSCLKSQSLYVVCKSL